MKKNRHILLLLFFFIQLHAFSQGRYAVRFADKANTPYSLAAPNDFLSQRAINRRIQQGIAIDQYDLPVNPGYLQGLSTLGASVRSSSRWLNAAVIEVANPSVLADIQALPYVSGISPVGIIGSGSSVDKFSRESIIRKNQIENARTTSSMSYGFSADQIQQIGLQMLHNSGFTGQGVQIAVIDAGFLDLPLMRCLDSIRLQGKILSTFDFVDNENDVYDDHYHGSAVLSCIASNIPDTLIGTAPHADFILLRSEDAGTETIAEEYYWAAAAEYADSAGADVLSTSLGYTTFDDSLQNHRYLDMDGNTTPITQAADIAASRGLIVVNSAGNEGASAWNYISAPADADSILAIGAVDINGTYAPFSGNGPTYDGRIKPDIAACGSATWLVSPYSNNQPVQGNGTSFSAPLIAGAMACLRQVYPTLHAQQLIGAIKSSANQYTNPDTLLGYGIPNFAFASVLLSTPGALSTPNSGLQVYPNPAETQEVIQLVLPFTCQGETMTLRMYDCLGQCVFSTHLYCNSDEQRISLSPSTNRTGGVYWIELDNSDKGLWRTPIIFR
jgi:serine protease AprX